MTIPNVLANRYASEEMRAIWSPEAKIVAERRLWLAVLRAQAELGVPVPEGQVAASPAEAWEAAQDIGLPVVVSSAVETSVGIAAGVALGAAIATNQVIVAMVMGMLAYTGLGWLGA